MAKPIKNWPAAMASRLGIGGEVEFTPQARGQLLHLPCAGGGGHRVDVKISMGRHPDDIAKRLLAQGWALGNKLKCPRHARKGSVRAQLMTETAETLPPPVELPSPPVEVKPMTPQEAGRARWRGMSKEERQAEMAKVSAAKVKKKEGEQEMASAAVAENQASNMTNDAKRAHRLVIAALEDYYDERSNTYRKDYSDRRIAEELNVSEASVAKTREDFFGPLAASTPGEIIELASAIRVVRLNTEERHRLELLEVERLEDKLEALCAAKGWTIP